MFGHVTANMEALSDEESKRYRAAYCGLCHALGTDHGQAARLGLSYDLTFLVLLLSSLYEPPEQDSHSRCLLHPLKGRDYAVSDCTHYAADMTVALWYYKALDDWQDDRSLGRRAYAALLEPKKDAAAERWPRQCAAIERELAALCAVEKADAAPMQADEAAAAFGRLLGEIFVWREDRWAEELRCIGYGLGRYIYLADAAVDYDSDCKKGRFNPLRSSDIQPQLLRFPLECCLAPVSDALRRLPLVQDEGLLKNILYSGIWMKYNRATEARGNEKQYDR